MKPSSLLVVVPALTTFIIALHLNVVVYCSVLEQPTLKANQINLKADASKRKAAAEERQEELREKLNLKDGLGLKDVDFKADAEKRKAAAEEFKEELREKLGLKDVDFKAEAEKRKKAAEERQEELREKLGLKDGLGLKDVDFKADAEERKAAAEERREELREKLNLKDGLSFKDVDFKADAEKRKKAAEERQVELRESLEEAFKDFEEFIEGKKKEQRKPRMTKEERKERLMKKKRDRGTPARQDTDESESEAPSNLRRLDDDDDEIPEPPRDDYPLSDDKPPSTKAITDAVVDAGNAFMSMSKMSALHSDVLSVVGKKGAQLMLLLMNATGNKNAAKLYSASVLAAANAVIDKLNVLVNVLDSEENKGGDLVPMRANEVDDEFEAFALGVELLMEQTQEANSLDVMETITKTLLRIQYGIQTLGASMKELADAASPLRTNDLSSLKNFSFEML